MARWWPDGGTTPFRGEKATTWEGGVRVPMLVRWPAWIPAGKISNGIQDNTDLFVTLAASAVLFGHERWRIENEGFNELCNHWHVNHYFHHYPSSITVLWLMLFIAHALFFCFLCNIKPCKRQGLPVYTWALLILAEFMAPLLSSA